MLLKSKPFLFYFIFLQIGVAEMNAEIENPEALAPWIQSLSTLDSGGIRKSRILFLGDSHIDGNIFTDYLRRKLQDSCGSGGRGWFMPRAGKKSYSQRGIRQKAEGNWLTLIPRGLETDSTPYGLAQRRILAAPGTNLKVKLEKGSASLLEVWMKPLNDSSKDSSMPLLFYIKDSSDLQTDTLLVLPSLEPKSWVQRIQIQSPFEFKEWELHWPKDARDTLQMLGLVWENEQPGCVVDAAGLNGSKARGLLRLDTNSFLTQLKWRETNLIILAFGTNEAMEGAIDSTLMDSSLTLLIHRLKFHLPSTSLLIIGPPDVGRIIKRKKKKILQRPPSLDRVIHILKNISTRENVAFWDQQKAMGGSYSVWDWWQRGLFQNPQFHPNVQGYEKLAEIFFQDLWKLYQSNP